MNNQREKNPGRAFLIAGILDDPRWERFASGAATLEEIAELRAWAQQSKAAKAIWDVFRPATKEEVDTLAANVLKRLGPQKPVRHDTRTLLDRAKDEARSSDSRMMTRHVPRKTEKRASGPTRMAQARRWGEKSSSMAIERGDLRSRGGEPQPKLELPPRLTQLFSKRNAPDSRLRIDAAIAIRPEATGTTSSRIALSREMMETSATLATAITTNPALRRISGKRDRNHHKRRIAWPVAAFFVATLGFIVAFIFNAVQPHERRDNAAPSLVADPRGMIPLQPKGIESAHVVEPSPPPLVEPAKSNVVPPDPPMPAPSASAMPMNSAALKMPIIRASPKKPAPKMVEGCKGTGVFQRCKKVPAPNWNF